MTWPVADALSRSEMRPVMSFDDVAWDESERIVDSWTIQFCRPHIGEAAAETLLDHHHPEEPVDFTVIGRGSYNICFRIVFVNSPPAVLRFPLPSTLRFPEEKTRNEAAIMRYLEECTSVPVPRVIHYGAVAESRLSLGPFLIMEYLSHQSTLYTSLNTPGRPPHLRAVLDPNISEQRLGDIYGQVAEIMLQLSLPSFSRIGCLGKKGDTTWEVAFRPHTLDMEQLCVMGTLPTTCLPHPRSSASPKKRRSKEGKVSNPSLNNGPFKLWCDDFRPANVIVDSNDRVCGVLDWEFTYAAPLEYTYAPPWWLLIEKPEYWEAGLDDWARVYEQRLQVFLRKMAEREDACIANGQMTEDHRLSTHMRQSWDTGDFWIAYACQHSFAFDLIYWEKIDPRFFGATSDPESAWKARMALLSKEELDEMESLVEKKMQEMHTRVLAWDCDGLTGFLSTYTKEALAQAVSDALLYGQAGSTDPAGSGSAGSPLESPASLVMYRAMLEWDAKNKGVNREIESGTCVLI
ncbi:Uncharacterized protein PECH_004623 [Penicillium ucsense]|uniref:Aminoglycoside phosphotransferase domain-containing protein n=1 Tax=Penicillium ucsense TaxID=2839758 RepID=A0A8J8WI78_9EURO|nr:Uncharacterized protein PECM_006154 [Penicillium ucsense]KAF7736965.1 Uncharacterized protein PECH_004623 [Penicillium ucsense]